MASKVITIRIDPEVKDAAESILKMLGITRSQAINMFYRMIVIKRGLPFQPVMDETDYTDETEYVRKNPEINRQLKESLETYKAGTGTPAPQEVIDEINRA